MHNITRVGLNAFLLAVPVVTQAGVRLPKVFTDNMVIQQKMPVAVWGWADSGESVTVTFRGKSAGATAGRDGKWSLHLPAMRADGKPHRLTVSGTKTTLTLKNVVLGEVWICGGQSNMNRSIDVRNEKRSEIRLFWVDFNRTPRREDLNDGVAGWVAATPGGLAAAAPVSEGRLKGRPRTTFTEVGYVFGGRLQTELKVPVGLIKVAVGGSTARGAWTPDPASFPSKYPFGKEVPRKRYLAHTPGLLYQCLIRGLVPFTVRGVVWYQGEDDGRNRNYARDFTALITSWRKLWDRKEMPFYFAQIAQTTYASGMLGVWEAQQRVMHTVPFTGLAVSNDIYEGTSNRSFKTRLHTGHKREPALNWPIAGGSNPHPPNKQLIAERLARIALVHTYKTPSRVVFGPMYASHKIAGAKIVVRFRYPGTGLTTTDGRAPNWFEISDGSKQGRRLKYVQAQAEIVGKNTIAVWSRDVKSPKHVRFGWHSLARFNLKNTEGLPAVSFRTDALPGHQR